MYNLGTDETVIVDESAMLISKHIGCSPDISHTGGKRGWIGDSPLIRLDTAKDMLAWLESHAHDTRCH